MSTLRNPVGPLPPQVYWRRRLLVGLGVLAVIIIIVLIIVRPGSGEPQTTVTPGPETTETAGASPEPSAPATEAGACTPGQVEVTPVVDASSYPADQQPMLSLTLLNTGTAACTMQAGTDVQEYLIMSGSDRIWASTDCQQNPTAAEVTLEPGEPVSSDPFAWSRTRSSPDDCEAERDPVIAGGATYRLSVSVGEFASEGDVPFILE